MKTLLPIITLASAVIAATPAFATNLSSDFVNDKITQHWELDTLEITQRIDIKKRREMAQKSSTASEKKLQAFETALKKLMQQDGNTDIDEVTMTDMISGFAQPGQDAQMIFMGATEDTMFPDQNELMLTDIADYETSMMIEEAFTLKADGSVIYPDPDTAQTVEQEADEGDENTVAKWSFDEEKQRLMMTEQQEDLSISASYKLVELTDNRLVLEGKQANGSTRMIFSSK